MIKTRIKAKISTLGYDVKTARPGYSYHCYHDSTIIQVSDGLHPFCTA